MSDLIQGIPYLSLNDAAIELSKITKSHNIDSKMILNLALHKKIRIFWHLRGQYLQDIQKINIDEAFETYGHYEINISEFPWKNDWLNELIYGTPAASQILHEVQVKNKNSIYRVVMPIKIRPPSEFCGCDFVPTENEIFVSREDIEALTHSEPAKKCESTEDNLLTALGVMAIMLARKISNLKISDRPNASKIADAVVTEADKILYPDGVKQFKNKDALRRDITTAVEHAEKIIQD